MCRHFTRCFFSICAHTNPIRQVFPFYIPPQYCSSVADALNHYHTQPDRMPEQFPMPFPQPCPPEAVENITLVVLGMCDRCAAEGKRGRKNGKIVEVPDGRETMAEGAGNGDVANGVRGPTARGAGGNGAGRNGVERPWPGEGQPAKRAPWVNGIKPGERQDDEKCVGPAKGPVIVTTPEVVGAWWVEGTSVKCEGWTTDKDGKRQASSVTVRSGLTACASN